MIYRRVERVLAVPAPALHLFMNGASKPIMSNSGTKVYPRLVLAKQVSRNSLEPAQIKARASGLSTVSTDELTIGNGYNNL
jgi:hypothetical protein